MDPTLTKAADQTFQYGALGIIAFIAIVGIVWAWKIFLKREDKLDGEREKMVEERKSWELAEANIRKECEADKRLLAEKFAKDLREIFEDANKHEDEIRREFASIMDNVAAEASKSSQALVDMLQKFYDRFVGPTRRY